MTRAAEKPRWTQVTNRESGRGAAQYITVTISGFPENGAADLSGAAAASTADGAIRTLYACPYRQSTLTTLSGPANDAETGGMTVMLHLSSTIAVT